MSSIFQERTLKNHSYSNYANETRIVCAGRNNVVAGSVLLLSAIFSLLSSHLRRAHLMLDEDGDMLS